jgi:hypothetical protein
MAAGKAREEAKMTEAGTEASVTQADADGLSEKLKTFVDTLTPGERDALRMALAPRSEAEADDVSGYGEWSFNIRTPFGVIQVNPKDYTTTQWGSGTARDHRGR